jgi:hypothetical protein
MGCEVSADSGVRPFASDLLLARLESLGWILLLAALTIEASVYVALQWPISERLFALLIFAGQGALSAGGALLNVTAFRFSSPCTNRWLAALGALTFCALLTSFLPYGNHEELLPSIAGGVMVCAVLTFVVTMLVVLLLMFLGMVISLCRASYLLVHRTLEKSLRKTPVSHDFPDFFN